MNKIKKFAPVIFSVFVLFELSLIFALYDLPISINLVNYDNSVAYFLEVVGVMVAPLLFSISGIIVAYFYWFEVQGKVRTLNIILGGVFAFLGLIYNIYSTTKLNYFWGILAIVVVISILSLVIYIIKKLDYGKLYQLYCIAFTTIIYCILVLLVISCIKAVWGRIRFRDLITLTQFTPWYKINGFTGNFSFPSGHTANATVIFVITMFVPIVKNKLSKILLWVIPCLYSFIMAYYRVVAGAHYCSDVLFGAAISISVFYLSKWITTKLLYKIISLSDTNIDFNKIDINELDNQNVQEIKQPEEIQ